MANVELAMRFKAPADRMWALLTGPELVPVLLETYAEKVEIDATGTTLTTTLRSGV